MNQIFDYIIIGAGPAGCFCSLELKKKGLNCIVLEKNKENSGKVCGGGISRYCIKILKDLSFPLERFEVEGAIRIEQYIFYYKDRVSYYNLKMQKDDLPDFAYGIERNKTNYIFRQYTREQGIPLVFDCNVKQIKKSDSYYNINGYCGREIIIACGALKSLKIFDISSAVNKLPFGVSAIIRTSEYRLNNCFLFDYADYFDGQYGWIFPVGEQKWNVGVWTKSKGKNVKELFYQFINSRVKDYEFITELKGAVMGISNDIFDVEEYSGIYIIGDSSYTSNSLNGEGIPQAILSGIELVNKRLCKK